MPTSVREQCLSAFFDLFAGLSDFPLKERNPNWGLTPAECPALVQMDGGSSPLGGDDVSSGISGTMRIAIRVTIIAGVRGPSTAALGPLMNDAHAAIFMAGANKILLAGKAWTQWSGDEDPIPLAEQGSPPAIAYPLSFLIITTQAEGDPYSF